jgi:hypothetical protein
LDVLRRTASQLLSVRARKAQHFRELVGDALEGLGGRVQARLQVLPRGLDAAAGQISPGPSRLLTHPTRFIGDRAGRSSRFVGGLIDRLIRIVIASSHLILFALPDKGSASQTSGPGGTLSFVLFGTRVLRRTQMWRNAQTARSGWRLTLSMVFNRPAKVKGKASAG